MTFLSRRARRFAAAIVLAACGVAPAWGANCNSAFGTLGTVVWLVTPSGCLPNGNILSTFPSLQSALSNWESTAPGTGTVIVIGGPNADGTGSTSPTGSVTIDLQTPNPPQIITAVPTNLSTLAGGQPEILISENGVSWTASNVFGGGSSVSLGNNVINTPYAIQVTSANVTLSGFSINDSALGHFNTAEVSLSGGGANVSNLNLTLEYSDNSRALDVESSGNTVSNSTVDVTDASNANYALTVGYDGSAVDNTFTGLNVSHINDDAAGFYTNSNTVAYSTFTSQAANASAMTMIGASSITITNSYISDPGGSGIYCNSGCGYLDVIGSTLAAGGSGNSALALNNAVGASISGSYLSGASSAYGAYIYNGSQFDSISQSTITASDPGAIALEVDGSSLTLINSYVDNTVLFSGVSGGTIAFSSITANGGPGGTALQLAGTSGVFVTNSFLNGASGTAAYLYDGSSGNTIAFSTMTGNYSGLFLENTGSNAVQNDSIYNSGGSGIVVDQGLGTTISNDFIQGSTGVFVDGSTDTVIDASQIIATGSGNLAWGVYFGFGGENLSMSADVVMPGASAQPFAGIDIDIGSGGLINISTNTVMSGSAGEGFGNGIYAAGPGQGGLQVWITSNTVVPAVPVTSNMFGIDINGLASGATIQDNDIYSGSPNGGPNSQYGIYAHNSPGLMINHNRIANPGMVQSGGGENYLGLWLEDSNNADVEFNDFYATGTQTGSGVLILLLGSSNARVRNNIFVSSFTSTTGYLISMDNLSQTGFNSDYNDFFSWTTGNLFTINGSLYSSLGAWQIGSSQDAHSISANPLWNNTSAGVEDFHPLSQAGRYNPATGLFVPDAQTSLTIDHGDPLAPVASPFGLGTEPGPNGGRVNQGSYGETSQASESYGSCGAYPNTVYIPGDASTIQGGIGLLTQNMSGEECVYISTGGFYNEMVTVSGFTNNNSSITIAMDPRVSTAPTVLQGFNIQNASVTIANINIVPTVAELSAISISSPDVTIASVTVNDAAQKVSTYGIGFSGSYGTGFNLNVTVTGGVASALVVSGSSNTISLSVFSSQYYGAQFQGSYDTISQSTISSSGLGTYGLYFSAQHDTATLCSISAPNGVGADISGNFNAITNSTVTAANSGPGYGLWINGGSTNTITGDYISNSAYTSVLFSDGAYNNVGGSTIASGGITSSFALWFQGANHNTITGSLIENANNAGGAAVIQSGSSFNQINQSTMTTNAASAPALEITGASSNTLTGDYIVTPAVCPGGSVNEAAYLFNADFNSISQSTMASNCSIGLGGATLYLSQSSSNTFTRDMIINQTGDAIDLDDTASSNTISFSTGLAGTTGNGVFVDLSSSNTFWDDYLASPFPGGGYGFELLNSNGSTIYGSTVTNDSGGTNAALYLYGASSTTILFDTINDPSGYGLYLAGNSNTNDISSDTILSGSPGIVAALYLLDSSTNEIEGDSISGGVNGAYGVLLDVGANGNLISGSALANDSASNAALVIRGSSNIVTGSYVSDQNSGGLRIAYGSAGNSVVLSTITSVNAEGVSVSTGLNTSLFNDYIQGSTAVYVSGSTGTVIGGSVLVADGASANADGVRLTGGSVGLSLSSSVVTGGVHGAGVYLDQGDSGFIGLSTNTIQTGSQYGIYAGNAQSGARIWISSNTIIPTPAPGYPTYGLYLLSLPSGATVQNNGIYWRTIGPPTGTLSSYGLYAGSVPGLVVNHNRISDSGMILSGSVISIGLAGNSSEADIEFNDFFSTGGGANMIDAEMIDISASAGARVRNNIFSSSVTASGYVAISVEDGASESGYSSDYNDFFSSNAFNSAAWGGTTYSLLGPWQAGSNQDAHSLSANPLWANPAVGVEDFHPLSEKARYDPLDGQMDSQDTANSPTIDRGDPAAGLSSGIDLPPTYHGVEPLPNGGIPNQGSYGQTDQASESSSPCGQTYYVRTDGSTGLSTIQSGVNSIVSPVTGQACVYISDGGTYTAPVTVSGITFGDNNSRVVIAMDPLGSGPPTVTNSFTIQNASVTVANIEFAPFGGSYNYVIQASSPNVTIASVSVIDIGSHIGFAGIAISSWTTISNSSVSVANVYGIEALGSYDSIFYSTAVDNSANDSALYLDGASSGTYQGLFLSNASGSGAQLYGASNDMISLSTISDNGSSGAPGAVYLLNATSNSITQSYLQGSAAPALQISGSNSNTISFSTVTSASTAGNNPTIWWLSGSSNVFTDTYLGNSYPDGAGVGIVHGNSNTVSFSTITSLTNGIQWGVSGDNNLITQSYLDNPNGYAVEFLSGSSSNTISQSTAASDTSNWPAIFVNGASTVTISQSMVVNGAGDAVDISNSGYNAISFSTVSGNGASNYALNMQSASTNTITSSYFANSVGTAAYLSGSDDNMISYSTMAGGTPSGSGTTPGGIGLSLNGASLNNVSYGVMLGGAGQAGGSSDAGPGGSGLYLAAGSSNTFTYSVMSAGAADGNICAASNGTANAGGQACGNTDSSGVGASGGHGAMLLSAANDNTISQSWMFGGGGAGTGVTGGNGGFGLYLAGSYNQITQSIMSAGAGGVGGAGTGGNGGAGGSPSGGGGDYCPATGESGNGGNGGNGAGILSTANFNIISQSTMTGGGGGGGASAAAGNGGSGLYIFAGSGNAVTRSVMSGGGGSSGWGANGGTAGAGGSGGGNSGFPCATTTLGGNGGHGAAFLSGANSNTISQSTLLAGGSGAGSASNGASGAGVYLYQSAGDSISNSYIASFSSAVYVSGSTGTIISASALATGLADTAEVDTKAPGANAPGSGLWLNGGSQNISLSSNVITGGSSVAGIYLDHGNSGFITLSTNTIQTGSQYGIYAANQENGTQLWISSNTILPPTSVSGNPSYGLYFNGLASGATVQDNDVYYRTAGAGPSLTNPSAALFAQNSSGLRINNNRFSNPGMFTSGEFAAVNLSGTTNTTFKFNDVNSTGSLSYGILLVVQSGSSNVTVKDNIFLSSMTGTVGLILVDAASQTGFASDYNDFFSSNTASDQLTWGGTGATSLSQWQTDSQQDSHSIALNPLWANPTSGVEDFHPLSLTGRYLPATGSFNTGDAAGSPTIDAGDPKEPLNSDIYLPPTYDGTEPMPNGGVANQGSYGRTDQASESASNASCAQIEYVRSYGSGGDYTSIGAAISALNHNLSGGSACVYISDGGTYNETVTVNGFTNTATSRIIISMDPAVTTPPIVQQGFVIENASVTIANINVVPNAAGPSYGVWASSPDVILSSVNVLDPNGHYNVAGIAISSSSTVSYSSVTVYSASGILVSGSNNQVTGSTITATDTGAYGIYFNGSSSNTVTQSYVQTPGDDFYFQNANSNIVSQSTAAGAAGVSVYINAGSSNTFVGDMMTSQTALIFSIQAGGYNSIQNSTMTANSSNGVAFIGSADNSILQSYVGNPNGYGVNVAAGANGTTISQSTIAVTVGGGSYALELAGASNNTVSGDLITNVSGDAMDVFSSNFNAISFSTITSLANSNYHGLYFGSTGSSSSNTVTGCYIAGDTGLALNDGSLNNLVSQSTIATTGFESVLIQSASNTVTQSYILDSANGGDAVSINGAGVSSNTISFDTITVTVGGNDALEINVDASANLIYGSVLKGASGPGLEIDAAAYNNTVAASTITSASGQEAVWLFGASTTTIVNSYIQGSTAVYVSGSTGTTIGGSVLDGSSGCGLLIQNGSENLALATSTLAGTGSGVAALGIAPGNAGLFDISTNTIKATSASVGVFIGTQTAGTQVVITSNTILPATVVSGNPAYGLWIDGLATGATIYNNGIFYRTSGVGGSGSSPNGNTSDAIFAQTASGLVIEHNRISNPGAVIGGNFAPIWFAGTTNSLIKLNDVNYTAPNVMTNAAMLLLQNGSTGITVEDNIFASSFTVTGSSGSLIIDASSLPNLFSDYNDFFSSTTAPSASLGNSNYVFNDGWDNYDTHSISANPLWNSTVPGSEDFHPLSKVGRLSGLVYVHDGATSLTIAHANPADGIGAQPDSAYENVPNQGSYGQTTDASWAPQAPLAPSVATAYQSSVTVTYPSVVIVNNGNVNPDGYQVDASTWNGFTGTLISSWTYTANNLLQLAPQGLAANTTYYFRVESLWLPSFSTASAVVVAAATLANPPTASLPTFVAGSSASLTFQWNVDLNPLSVTTYTVVLSTSPNFSASLADNVTASTVPTAAAPVFTLASSSLLPNTTYNLYVAALNWDGAPTTFINLGSTATWAALPSTTPFTSVSSTSITLNWSANGNPAGTPYTVLTSTDPNPDSPAVGSVVTTSQTYNTSLSTSGLSAFTTYYFQIEATNVNGTPTGYTAAASTMTGPAVLSPPSPVGLIVNISSITATWQLSQDATGYGLAASLFPANPPTSVASSTTFSCSGPCSTAFFDGTLSGLNPNTSYYVFVQALGADTATAFNVFQPTATLAAWPTATGSEPFESVLTTTMTVSWQANGNPAGSTYTVVLSSGSSYPNSYTGNIVLSTAPTGTTPTFTFTNVPDNSSFTFYAAAVNWEGSSTPYINLGSTVTLITTPTAVFLDDVSSTSLVVSAYAPAPSFNNLGVGQSGTNEYDSLNGLHGFHGEAWTVKSPMSSGVSQLSVVALNGVLYAVDGYNGSPTYTNSVYAYSTSGGGWTSMPITSQARGDVAAGVLQGQIYVAGGSNNGGSSANPVTEVFNAGVWSSTQSMSNTNADSYMASAVLGNKLYAIGGYFSGQSLTPMVNNVFDPVAGQWSTQASIPAGLAQAAAATVSSSIYVLGGYNGSAATTDNYAYQGTSWNAQAPLPAPLYAAAAVELGGRIYLLGGTGNGSTPNDVTYVYDPSANQWATVTDAAMPTARWSLGAAESGGRIYAVGGANGGSSALTNNEQYDPGVATLITGLSPNNSYTFKAEARNQAGTVTGFSNTVTTYTLAALPTLDPTVFPDVYIGSVTVQWDNGNNNPTSSPVTPYQAQASTAPNFASGAALLSTGWLSPTSFPTQGNVPSMLPNTTYYFQVQAENASGAPTLFVSMGSTSTLAAPPGPVVSTYSAVGAGGFTMTWSSGTSLEGYNPADTTYYAQVALSSTPFVAVQTATTTSLSAAFTGLNVNTLYFTQVEAVNNNGIPTGFVAFGDTATTVSPPAPTNSTSTFLPVYNSSLTVNWLSGGDPTGTTYYAQISSDNFATILASSQTYNLFATFTGLTADTTYYLQAAAYSASLSTWTTFTNLQSTSTLAFAPVAAPFSAVTTSAIQANWLAGSNPSSSTLYDLEASTSPAFAGVVTSSLTYNLFVDTAGLSVNTTYYFQVAAINNNGVVTAFTAVTATATLAVPASTAPITNVSSTSIQFNWTAPGNPPGTTYAALVSTDPTMGLDGSIVTASDTFNTSLSTAGLTPATTYFFEVQTLGYNQATPLTAQISTMTLPALPGSAASTFTAVGAQALSLAWTADGNPQSTKYIVQLSTDDFATIDESSCTYNLFAAFGVGGAGPVLTANTSYYLRVEAVDASGSSGFLALGSTSTLVAPPGPAVSTFTAVNSTSITLNWSSGTAVTGFNGSSTTYVAQVSASPIFSPLTASVLTQTTYYAFTGLVINTQYYFQVEALGNAGENSGFVNYGTTDTVTAPPAQTSPAFSPVFASSLTVNWSADGDPAGTTFYALLATDHLFNNVIASSITYNTFAQFAGLSINTTYYAEAAAYNLSNATWTTFTPLTSTSTLAAQPSTSTIVNVTTMSIKVSWTANGNPAGTLYDVQYSTTANFSAPVVSTLTYNLSASTCALASNTTYFIEVAAINNDGLLSAFASFGSTSTLAAQPSTAPFTAVSSTSIQFNWLSNSNSTSTVYTALASTDSTMGADGSVVTSSQTYNTFLSTAGLAPATTYFFEVEALGNNGAMTAPTTQTSTMTLPALPTAGAFVAVSTYALTAQWAVGGNPSGVMYVAQISTNNFATINASSCTHNLSVSFGSGGFGQSLIPNTTYSVRVEAVDLSGSSGFLVVGSTWTLAAPPAVLLPTFTGETSSSLSLIWSASGNPLAETTYTVVLTTDAAGYPNSYTGNVTLSTAPAGSPPSAVVSGLIGADTYYLWVDAAGNDGLATGFVAMSSAATMSSSSPTISDLQAGDLVWRTSNSGSYTVGAFNTGSGLLSYFAVEASTVPGGGGPFEVGFTSVTTDINASSYSLPWSLPSSFFAALANGPTNYITFQAVDTSGNETTQADVFFIKKDTTVPGFANGEAGGVVAVSTAPGTFYILQATETASGLAGFQYSASLNTSGDASLIPWTNIESTAAIYGSTASVAGWQISWSSLSATSTNYISVRAWNVAGATATLDDAFYVIKDTAGPIVSITSPNQSFPFLSALAAVTGTAISGFPLQGTEVSIAQLGSPTYYWNNGFNSVSPVWLPVVSSGTASSWNLSIPSGLTFANGAAYEIVARSSDTSGVYSQNYSTVTFTMDTSMPVVVVTTPTTGVIVSTVLYSVSGTAVDPSPDSGISIMQLELRRLDTGQWWNFYAEGTAAQWQGTAVATAVVVNSASGSAASTWTYHTDPYLRGALVGGTSYFIAVSASNNAFPANASSFSQGGSTFTFVDQETPAAVTNLAGQPGALSGQIALTWTAAGNNKDYGLLVSGAYAVGASTYPTFAFSTAAAVATFAVTDIPAGSSQSYTVNGLAAGDTYYLVLWTQNASGNWSPLSNLATAQAEPAPPDEITGQVLTVSTQGITGVEVDAYNSQGTEEATTFTLADGSGTFVLQNLAAGSYTLTATWSVNGEASSVSLSNIPLSSGVDFVLNLSYTLGALTGQFASSSAPPSSGGGLTVSSYKPSAASGSSQQYVEVWSNNKRVVQMYPDPTGKWTVPNLLPGPYSVRAFNGLDYTPFTVVNLQEGQTAIVTFSFDPLPTASVYAFPNPARTSTTIRFETALLPLDAEVEIFDVAGNLVYQIPGSQIMAVGSDLYHATWPLVNSQGQGVASGIYLAMVKIKGGSNNQTAQVITKIAVVK